MVLFISLTRMFVDAARVMLDLANTLMDFFLLFSLLSVARIYDTPLHEIDGFGSGLLGIIVFSQSPLGQTEKQSLRC